MSNESKALVDRLMNEADQCRNDGADDIARLLDEAVRELHNLNWALGTPGFEKMATPEDQAEHEEGVRSLMKKVEWFKAKTVRFCPECGSLGEVPEGARDCCPDGSHAAYMPEKTAEKCAALFRDAQLAARVPDGWKPLTDQDRERAMRSMPDMLEGFLKKWGWLHFSKAIEEICREKNMISAAPSQPDLKCQSLTPTEKRPDRACDDSVCHLIGGCSKRAQPEQPSAQGEPYGCVTVVRRLGCAEQHFFYRHPNPPYLDNASECVTVYTHPQQASEPMTSEELWPIVSTARVELFDLAQKWSDNKIHSYQFAAQAEQIVGTAMRDAERHHNIKGA